MKDRVSLTLGVGHASHRLAVLGKVEEGVRTIIR
jgi:hypothetical protein